MKQTILTDYFLSSESEADDVIELMTFKVKVRFQSKPQNWNLKYNY